MNSQRMHYMTLCYRGDVEVTHINRNGSIEVTFEQAKTGGFNTLVMTLEGKILSNEGFNNADVAYYQDFVKRHTPGIIMESKGII